MSSGAFADARETWNRRFDTPDLLFGAQPNHWLIEHAKAIPTGGCVLCVADGEGRNSIWLAQHGFRVEAFDISDRGVAKAQSWASRMQAKVSYSVADCDNYPWAEHSFNAVVAIFVQFADPDMRARLFANMVRSLRPGGVLIVQGYTPKQLEHKTGGPPFESHLYTPERLRELVAGLTVLNMQEYEADLTEGSGHKGRSALIGLVAQRPISQG